MTNLREVLQNRNAVRLNEVEYLVAKATPHLWHTYATFSSGTKHTPEHTLMVEEIAGWLLTDEILSALNDDEIALLILSCHYHDLGMAGTEEDNETPSSRDQVRREHAVSIGHRIVDNWKAFGFENETMATVLADVCKGHRPSRINGVAHWEDLPETRILGPKRIVRVRLLSAMIYAADELHIGEDRAPKREEDFQEIRNVLSKRHWCLHQAIQGPVLDSSELRFEVSPASPAIEAQLRKTLYKAFSAVSELASELLRSRIDAKPNSLHVVWNRKKMWQILVPMACGDLIPKSLTEICDDTRNLYSELSEKFQLLTDVCSESCSQATLSEEIKSSVNEFISQNFLISTTEGEYELDGSRRTVKRFFNWAKDQDEVASLFYEIDAPQYERQLHLSKFGKRYVRDHVYAQLNADYQVDLVQMPSMSHVKSLLEHSPTATRMVELNSPPQGLLVHTDLLQLSTIAGLCADMLSDPEVILENDFRHSVDALFSDTLQRLPRFLQFIKELAIIGKLNLNQVAEAVIPSDEETSQTLGEESMSWKLTQTLPSNNPFVWLPTLMLARNRADLQISIRPTEAATLSVNFSEKPEQGVSGTQNLALMTLGDPIGSNAIPRGTWKSSFRGRIFLNSEKSELILKVSKLTEDDSSSPILFQVMHENGSDQAKCTISMITPDLTVQDSMVLSEALRIQNERKLELKVLIDGQETTPIEDINLEEFAEACWKTFVPALVRIDPQIPFPALLSHDVLNRLSESSGSALESELEKSLRELSVAQNKITVTTIFFRFTSVENVDYYEEFLGFMPEWISFNAPTVCSDEVSQETINELWATGGALNTDMTFREDQFQLAESLRKWADDPKSPFPFSGSNDLHFHYARTRMMIHFGQVRDRTWYRERRVVFRFRPVRHSERYRLEQKFWQESGDHSRAKMLGEMLTQALNIEEENRKQHFAEQISVEGYTRNSET